MRTWHTAVALTAVLLFAPTATEASTDISRPFVSTDRSEVAVGDAVQLTIDGFVTSSVTISICGNAAYRGSGDCNMPASKGQRLDLDGTETVVDFTVSEPPKPCPCVIRVSSHTLEEIAVVPIRLLGHGVSPPQASSQVAQPIAVSLRAVASDAGLGRAARRSLGGSTTYDVTVVVRNRSSAPVEGFSVAVAAGRDPEDELVSADVIDAVRLEPGATWERTVPIDLPALTLGEVTWTVSATSEFATAEATSTTSNVALLLYVLTATLAVDLLILGVRQLRRVARRARNGDRSTPVRSERDDDVAHAYATSH